MIRTRLLATAVSGAVLLSLPGGALAQEDQAPALEGTEWSLISYFDETAGEVTDVPFEVQPTLLLDEGTASGLAGCNQFGGSYELDGSMLTFGGEMSVTLAFCEGPGQTVEDSYLAALGQVGGWSIEGEQLALYDNLGNLTLVFEVPSILWTPSQVASLLTALEAMQVATTDLQTEIDTLRDATDSLNVPRLRERIKALESENKKLTRRLNELESAPAVDPAPRSQQTSSFTAAEKVLLKGIPTRIANNCSPLRSSLPKGTQAALTCRPNTGVVSSVDYFLLDGQRAATAFGSVMQNYNVPESTADGQTCVDGTKSQRYIVGSGWQAEGCYRENKVAQLRFVDNATDCRKLKVGSRTLGSPAIYMALQGTNNDVARVYRWATKGLDPASGQLTSITQTIPSNAAASPSCPT